MKRVLYKGVEHVLSRKLSDRIELVALDGTLVNVDPNQPLFTAPERRRPLVPGQVAFKDRPFQFVNDLHAARLQWLLDQPKIKREQKRIDKAQGLTGPGSAPRVRGKKGPKKDINTSLAEMIAAKLREGNGQ